MIFPRTVDNRFSNYLEASLFQTFSELGERYSVFYKVWLQNSKTENSSGSSVMSFILLDKRAGIIVLDINQGGIINTNFQNIEPLLKEELLQQLPSKKIPPIKIFSFSKNDEAATSKLVQELLTPLTEEAQLIDAEDFSILEQFFKVKSAFYAYPIQLKSLEFENYKGIKKIALNGLPKGASWFFITGENGFGKTSFLQALAISLDGKLPKSELQRERFEESPSPLQANLWTIIHKNEVTACPSFFVFSKGRSNTSYHSVLAYGASRLDIDKDPNPQRHASNPIESLFSSQYVMRNIEDKLLEWNLLDRERFEKTKQILEELLPAVKIEIVAKKSIWYKEKAPEESYFEAVSFDELAAGYRSLLALFGDMIIRLYERQPDVIDPKEFVGLIIIDEIALHWHPKWQRKLPTILSQLFPKLIFVVSTHSPIPLLGAPKNSVILTLNRTQKDGITVRRLEKLEQELPKLLPNLILSSDIFNMDDLAPISAQQEEILNFSASMQDKNAREQAKEHLKALFKELEEEED